jgi:hypothetical protein
VNLYYEQAIETAPDRHRILLGVRELDLATYDPAGLAVAYGTFPVDEIPVNADDLFALGMNLTTLSAIPDDPALPVRWQYVDGTGATSAVPALRRSDGSLWVPAPNTDKNEFLADAPALIDRLQEIEDTVVGSTLTVTQRALKDVSKGLRQVVKYLKRTLKHE